MLRDYRIDQSATSIQIVLNTNGASFLMMSHVRSALWPLRLSQYEHHYRNEVRTYHGAVCLCAHMATTCAFDIMQNNIKILFKYVVQIWRK